MKKRIIAAILSVLTIFSAVPSFAMNTITDTIPNVSDVDFTSETWYGPYTSYCPNICEMLNYDDIYKPLECTVKEYLQQHSAYCYNSIVPPLINITDFLGTSHINDNPKVIIDSILQNINDGQSHITDNLVPEYSNDSITNNSIAEQMLTLVNKEREAQGLSSLILDTKLTQAAQYKAEDMSEYGFSHDGSYGGLQDLLNRFNISYASADEQRRASSQYPKWQLYQIRCWLL